MVRERHRAGSRDRLGHDADELHPGLHPAARHSRPVFDRVRRSLPRRREAAQVHGLRRRADHAAMRRIAALVPVVTLFHAAVVGGADLVVLCPNALATAVSRVGDEHRAATRVGVRLVTDTAGGLASHAAAAARDKPRLLAQGTQALDAVSRGEIELAVSPVSEIVVREGLQMVGRLPADLGARPSYSAAVLATTAAPEAARALIERLLSDSGRAALASVGFDPPDTR